jgi:hypothetical protein
MEVGLYVVPSPLGVSAPVSCSQIRSSWMPTNSTKETRPVIAGQVMFASVNLPVLVGGVPTTAILAGAEGIPFASSAQTVAHSVVLAGRLPPVMVRMTDPMPGAPAPVGLNCVTGSLPVISSTACWLPSESVLYSWSESKVHSPGNRASFAAACT